MNNNENLKKILCFFSFNLFLFCAVNFLTDLTVNYAQYNNFSNSLFSLSIVHNQGAAFGILEGQNLTLILFGILSLFLIIFCFFKNLKNFNYFNILTFSILFTGILGNLLQRIFDKMICDFINLKFIDFPIFNYFDIMISFSFVFLCIEILRKKKTY